MSLLRVASRICRRNAFKTFLSPTLERLKFLFALSPRVEGRRSYLKNYLNYYGSPIFRSFFFPPVVRAFRPSRVSRPGEDDYARPPLTFSLLAGESDIRVKVPSKLTRATHERFAPKFHERRRLRQYAQSANQRRGAINSEIFDTERFLTRLFIFIPTRVARAN